MYFYSYIDVYLNLEIQNGLCKTQELIERWKLPVCDIPMTACWGGFNFAEVTRKGWEGLKQGFLRGILENPVQALSSILYNIHSLTKIHTLINSKGLMQKRIEDVIVYYKLAQVKCEDRQWARNYLVPRKAVSSTAKACPLSLEGNTKQVI